jgi:hypothetical protein
MAAAALAVTGCGGGADAKPEPAGGGHTVRVERVAFPARQHLAQHATFAITVRNAGDTTIASVTGTLRGLAKRAPDGTDQKVWIADAPRDDSVAGIDDARIAGPLNAGDAVTLRWDLTATAPGRHVLTWEVAAGARTRVAGGGKLRGSVTTQVVAKPPFARVDPRTGLVIREKRRPSG